MDKKQHIVAFEIGSSKIVGVIAEKSSSGIVTITHLLEQNPTNCVRYGCVQNVENIKSTITRMTKDFEDRIDGRITQVYLGISGRSLHSEVSEVNRSVDPQKAITGEIIDSIIRDASRNPIKNLETIAVVPRTFYVDKNATVNPVGLYGSSVKIKVNLIVAKPQIKQNLTRVMASGPQVKEYIVTPLAVGESVLTESERLSCMLVDIGAETTTVSIYKDGSLAYLSTLPLGGRNITRDISNGLGVLEETAERVKKNINNPLEPANVDSIVIEGVAGSDAANYIDGRNREILANIKNQITLAGLTTDDIRSIVLIGGGAQLQGLPKKLDETINIPVRIGHHPQSLQIQNHDFNRPEYTQIFALVTKAANEIDPSSTCIERRSYDDGPTIRNITREQTEAEQPKTPEKPQKPKKGGFFDKLKEKFGTLLSEDDDDTEDDDNK